MIGTTTLFSIFLAAVCAEASLCIAVGPIETFPEGLVGDVSEHCDSTVLVSSLISDEKNCDCDWCFGGDASDIPLGPRASVVFALDSWDFTTSSALEHIAMLRRWLSPNGRLYVVQSLEAKGRLTEAQWKTIGFVTHSSEKGVLVLVYTPASGGDATVDSRNAAICDLFDDCEDHEGRLRRHPSLYQNNQTFAVQRGSWWNFKDPSYEVPKYFTTFSEHVARLIPESALRILDVGCGAGLLLRQLKDENENLIVEGIEPNRVAAVAARTYSRLDAVYEGLAEDVAWQLPDNAYDAIIFSDVLEHAVHPDLMLRSLSSKLKPQGRVCVSVPNVRFWTEFIQPLLDGSWDYAEHGVRDKTHLRWFTHESFLTMARAAGFVPDGPAMRLHFGEEHKIPQKVAQSLVDVVGHDAAARLFEESDVRQFLIPLKKVLLV